MVKKAIVKSISRKTHKEVQKVLKAAKAPRKLEVKSPEEFTRSIPVVPVYKQPGIVLPVLPVVEGVRIVKILEGGHTKTHFKCEGVDRNGNNLTLHVLKDKF